MIELLTGCPKCGALDWHHNWMAARGQYIPSYDHDQMREEHIHSRCKVCGYEKDSAPVDAPPAAPKEEAT